MTAKTNKKQRFYGEAGFTVTELLAAISVLSAAALISVRLVSATLDAVERSRESLLQSAALLRTDSLIREKTALIAVPYWERRPRIIQTGSSIEIPWYGGEAEQTLVLRGSEAGLVIAAAGEEISIEGFRMTGLGILSGEAGEALGVELNLEYRGKTYRLASPFGSFPVKRRRT